MTIAVLKHSLLSESANNIFVYSNNPVDKPQPVTVYNYAIETIHKNTNDRRHKSLLLTEQTARGANSSLQSMSTLRGSNSVPLGLCTRCYPIRYWAPRMVR